MVQVINLAYPQHLTSAHHTVVACSTCTPRYKALAGELVIAGVFVRVYDQQPAFAVSDPASLCRGLVTYLHTVVRPPQADTSATAWLPAPPPAGALPEGSVGGTPAWAVGRAHLLCTLRALSKLLEAVPKVNMPMSLCVG